MDSTALLIKNLILFSLLFALGTVGYMVIEKWNVVDAMYMTIITIATVGYKEVHPVSAAGRIFTLLIIFSGVGLFLYVFGNVMQFLVEGRIRLILGRRKLDRIINKLAQHYIICGYGRIGRGLSRYLLQKDLAVVIIERDDSRIEDLERDNVPYVIGSANEEDNLKRAGITRAKGLLSVLGSDPDNVFVVLISKQLNPDLFVVARANQDAVKKTLHSAGADKVISPYDLGARRMAHAVLRPTVIHFLELAFTDQDTDINLEEIPVSSDSQLVDKKLMDCAIRKDLNLLVIAIKRADGEMVFNPESETRIQGGDTIIAVGKGANLMELANVCTP